MVVHGLLLKQEFSAVQEADIVLVPPGKISRDRKMGSSDRCWLVMFITSSIMLFPRFIEVTG
jgi:hypothetical protein